MRTIAFNNWVVCECAYLELNFVWWFYSALYYSALYYSALYYSALYYCALYYDFANLCRGYWHILVYIRQSKLTNKLIQVTLNICTHTCVHLCQIGLCYIKVLDVTGCSLIINKRSMDLDILFDDSSITIEIFSPMFLEDTNFETSTGIQNDSRITLKSKVKIFPYTYVLVMPSTPNFILCHSTASFFWLRDHFSKSAQNDSETTGSTTVRKIASYWLFWYKCI